MSTTTTAAVDGVVEGAGEKDKPSRKFPLPCWTQDETLALIDVYRERWYSLRRGYLRTADWDAVAAAVGGRYPDISPAKTPAQCRHKMEKLRQRYRAEKQRSLSFPTGRFFSSWFFFENMDAMENGTTPGHPGSRRDLGNSEISGNGIPINGIIDQNMMKIKLNNDKKLENRAAGLQNSSNVVNGRPRPNFESKGSKGYSSYAVDVESDKEEDELGFEGGLPLKNPVLRLLGAAGFEGKKYAKPLGDLKTYMGFNSLGGKGFDAGDGLPMESSGNDSLLPPRLRVKRIGKTTGRGANYAEEMTETEANDGFYGRVASSRNSALSGTRGKYGGHLDSEILFRERNGFTQSIGDGDEKRGRSGGNKRERDPIEEIVLAIKMLGEGFVKMEKTKMDLAMEMEKNRMEMEMKRHELILQSQGQIVDAFVRGFLEVTKKMKMEAVSES